MTRRLSILLLFTAVILFWIIPHTVQAAPGDQYRRWLNGMTASCTTGSGVVYAELSNQNVEFSNLPADAQFTINYIENSVITTDGPYTVEQTTGTKNYGAFQNSFASYPFTFEFRLDTIISGIVVYQSSIIINCAADTAAAPATIVNVVPPNAQARVWTPGKTFTCGPNGGGVAVTLNNQNVDVINLSSGDQFTLNYIENSVITTDGPYPVEQPNGRYNYASFLAPFPAYPFTFEFRIDTLVGGEVVYQSSLIVTCTADATGTVTIVNGPPESVVPPAAGVSALGCLSTFPSGAPLAVLAETAAAYYLPDLAATTNIVLPVGSSWRVITTQGDFTRLWIACYANPIWVETSSLTS